MTTPEVDDQPLDPAAMLALSREQQSRVNTTYAKPMVAMLASWAIAWGVGFLVLWSGIPENNSPVFVPQPAATIIFALLIVAASVTCAVLGIRMNRGIRGSSNYAGAVYGATWSIASFGAAAVGVALLRAGMSSELAGLFFPAIYSLVVGIIYLAGAAIWRDKGQLILGIWIIAVGSIAPFFGYPGNFLLMSILGGGGFAVGAIAIAASLASTRKKVSRG